LRPKTTQPICRKWRLEGGCLRDRRLFVFVGSHVNHFAGNERLDADFDGRQLAAEQCPDALGEGGVAGTEVRGVEKQEDHLAVVEDLIKGGENGDDGIDRSQYFLGYDDPATHKESEYWIQQANDRCKRERATNDLPGLVQVSQRVIEE
jgi:hypothetical protein